jgi:hypothetical protein
MSIERFLSDVVLRRRSMGIFLVLAVFFLLLHFHPATAASSHISNECSCLHGTRAQAGVSAVAPQWAVPLQFVLHESFEPRLVSQTATSFQSIRAPPAL